MFPRNYGWWHIPSFFFPLSGYDPYKNSEIFAVIRNPYERLVSEVSAYHTVEHSRSPSLLEGIPCSQACCCSVSPWARRFSVRFSSTIFVSSRFSRGDRTSVIGVGWWSVPIWTSGCSTNWKKKTLRWRNPTYKVRLYHRTIGRDAMAVIFQYAEYWPIVLLEIQTMDISLLNMIFSWINTGSEWWITSLKWNRWTTSLKN